MTSSPDAAGADKFERILETVPNIAVQGYAPDGTVRYWNKASETLYGYSAAEAVGKNLLDLVIPPEMREEVRIAIRHGAETGEMPPAAEMSLRCKSGDRVPVFSSHAMVAIPGADPELFCLDIDLREQKRQEEALRRKSEELDRYFEGSLDLLCIANAAGKFVRLNPEWERVLGYPLAELQGRSFIEFVHPEDQEATRKTSAGLAEQKEVIRFVNRYRCQDGSYRWIEWNSHTMGDLSYAVARDITERVHTEEQLRRTSRWLQHTQRISQVGGWTIDPRTGAIWVSPEARRIYGWPADEELTLAIIRLIPLPNYRPLLDQAFKALVEQGHPYDVEFRIRRASDAALIDIHSLAEYDRAEGLVVGVIHDITERKRAETDRLEMERRLLHAQKLESLGVLAGGIAHDFNNLLMAILGNLDLALMDLSPHSPARTSIEQSVLAARRAADLTRQMLAYSGKGSFDVRSLDLSELVTENAHLFRACISKLVTLRVEAAGNLPPIRADLGQLQQVVMNLITNASEAIGDAPGLVCLRTGVMDCDDATLRRSRADVVPSAGRFVYVEVTDTGCGMDETTQQRLFDPFFTTKFTGRGLGMSALLGIVRGHEGAIFVDSTVGRGTTIQVLLPAEPAGAAPAANPVGGGDAGAPAVGASPGTVLIVDDEEVVRRVCKLMFVKRGWQVLEAADGPAAIEIFRRQPAAISCVILDLSMPRMKGLEVFRRMRSIRPDIRIVLSSGYSSDSGAGELPAAEGLAGFIQKPYTSEALFQEVERALRQT